MAVLVRGGEYMAAIASIADLVDYYRRCLALDR